MLLNEIAKIDSQLKIVRSKNDSLQFYRISIPEEASHGSIVFISNIKYLKKLNEDVSADEVLIVTDENVLNDNDDKFELYSNLITYDDFASAICSLSKKYYDRVFQGMNFQLDGRQNGTVKISPDADIAQNVFIGEKVKIESKAKIHPGVVIMGECVIGAGSEIFPNVTVYPFSQIGENCRIHANTVIGSDGFGYNFTQGQHLKVWHTGGVIIGNDVEIGSNTSVDMGAFTPTEIGNGTKIDNFCQISHNSKIGKHCVFCGRAGVSGSCIVEDYVIFGAGAGAAPGVHLKAGTQVAACAIISENAIWGPNETIAGHPARPLKEHMRTQAKLNLLAKKK